MPKTATKKLETIEDLMDRTEKAINGVADLKKRKALVNWLIKFYALMSYEEKFDPARWGGFKPGDVIDVHFGFNIGSELRGVHFAVVVENNTRRDTNVMVVPLSSYVNKSDLHPEEVDLGVITKLNEHRKNQSSDKGTRALVSQMRIISKMRIYPPKDKKGIAICRISSEDMEYIYDKIKENYCHHGSAKD